MKNTFAIVLLGFTALLIYAPSFQWITNSEDLRHKNFINSTSCKNGKIQSQLIDVDINLWVAFISDDIVTPRVLEC